MSKSIVWTVRFPAELAENIRIEAKKRNVNVNNLINQAIASFLLAGVLDESRLERALKGEIQP